MAFSLIINYEKFNAYKLIKSAGIIEMRDHKAIIREALIYRSVVMTRSEIQYMEKNFEKLLREFKE